MGVCVCERERENERLRERGLCVCEREKAGRSCLDRPLIKRIARTCGTCSMVGRATGRAKVRAGPGGERVPEVA